MVPELNREDMRELIVGDYHIVYRVDDEVVFLLTIYRSSRLFPRHLFDE
jgi:mRNA-degrading endonuclease RelE of RelBE toxin-antitoxin system